MIVLYANVAPITPLTCDYIVEESRVSWMINSGGMRTVCPCVSRLTGSASQTQAKRQECYLLVSHHIKGMSGHYSPWECVWQTLAVLCPCQLFFSCNCPSTDSRKTKRKWEELGRKKQGLETYCHSKPLSYLLWYDDVVTVAWWYYGPLLSEGELGNTKKEWGVTRPARNCSILSACNKNKKFFKIKFLYHNFHTLFFFKETHVNSHVISVWQSSKWKNTATALQLCLIISMYIIGIFLIHMGWQSASLWLFFNSKQHICVSALTQEVKPAHPPLTNHQLSIFPRPEWKILISDALTSDIRQATDVCWKCCRSKQELRIWNEDWGSLLFAFLLRLCDWH